MSEAQIKHMVEQFLRWKLPAEFRPDGGISFEASYNNGTPEGGKHEPTGTNLLDYTQAKAMVMHMLVGLPQAKQIASLGVTIDASQVKDATEALNTLTDAAERTGKALNELGGKAHGGITIQVVGSIAKVDITPLDRIIAHGADAIRSA